VFNAMLAELNQRSTYLADSSVESIYLGGGTPSVMKAAELHEFISQCRALFEVSPDAEITLEANPDDVSEAAVEDWLKAGINRVSIGIQSFDEDQLKQMNRSHNAAKAKKSLQLLSKAFNNITADLMYGLLNDTLGRLVRDVDVFLEFNIPHISTYCLTIEDKTAYGKWYKKGQLDIPEDDLSIAQYDYLISHLTNQNFEHYEISNFGKKGFFSRHNSNYWKGSHYLGIGPGAHSYNGESRQFNKENNVIYAEQIEQGVNSFEIEFLDEKTKLNEYSMTRLRTIWGIDLDYIQNQYAAYWNEFTPAMENLLREGLLVQKENCIFLTQKGKHFSDRITRELFLC
jgi:oxygen-independent coproporphyrinogen-3 oxidase